MAVLAPAYRPRRPTDTVLYGVVRTHLETFLAYARDTYDAPLPRYVEQELRAYLRCGVFAHGFVRAHCDRCGHDLLVAFSCKRRGVCPSCAGRRMANTAAHLVDRVLPAVPVRQWVLSLPFELRALAAFRADVLSVLVRGFVESVFARHREYARRQGLGEAPSGAVTFVQRFGSSVNLNVHFHTMVLDGVFTRDAHGSPVFHAVPPPTREELEQVLRRVHCTVVAWLERKGLLAGAGSDTGSQQPAEQIALQGCAALAMQRGSVRALPHDEAFDPELEAQTSLTRSTPAGEGAVDFEGFNLQAGVRIAAQDDVGRERLLRYGGRPALSVDRLRQLPSGHIAYRIKKLRGGRTKHRVMTPLEFLARLAALVPPPRYPLLRYHGVLGPRSPWRRDIVPKAPPLHECAPHRRQPTESKVHRQPKTRAGDDDAPAHAEDVPAARETIAAARGETVSHATAVAPSVPAAVHPQACGDIVLLAPNILSVKHWGRLLGGRLYAASPRVDWATLLRRSFDVDVVACARCGGRLGVLGEVTDPALVRLVLEALGLLAEAPRTARARDPTELLGGEDMN